MMMGHFATALIPYSRVKGASAWLLLLCAALPDFLWLTLALFGIETPRPDSFLDVSIIGLKATMPFSHTGVGVTLLALATFGIVQGIWKNKSLSIWCGVLVVLHWLCDLLSGWHHEVLWAGTPNIGLDLYARSPYIAFAIEIVFSAALVSWFVKSESKERPLTTKQKAILYASFVGGSTIFLPTAYSSLRALLGLGG
jgi:hypothetical protein